MKEIAKEAKVSQVSIYNYFGNKDGSYQQNDEGTVEEI
ncbi:helix-turn-helix domain-containing protein [Bacillus mobilis]